MAESQPQAAELGSLLSLDTPPVALAFLDEAPATASQTTAANRAMEGYYLSRKEQIASGAAAAGS